MNDLARTGDRGQQRVIAQTMCVAVAGTLLGLARHLTDCGVDIDRQRPRCRPSRPRPLPGNIVDRFELADMTKRKGSQERAQRRRCHHPMRHHRLRRPGAQHVGVIDVRTTGQHRVQQRQHLTAR